MNLVKIDVSNLTERLADTFGEAEALVNIERGRRFSFRDYHRLTNRIVHMMRDKLDLRRGDTWVGILDNDNLSLLHFLTAMKGEACGCYTNYRDSVEDHAWQIDEVNAKVVFVERDLLATHLEMLIARNLDVVVMDPIDEGEVAVKSFWSLLEDCPDTNPHIEHDDRDHTFMVRFTGGTTGRGKTVAYSIDNWLMCRDSYYAVTDPVWDSNVRMLHMAPISHGSGMFMLPTLFKGGCNVTMNMPDLDKWCAHVEAERIDMAFLVPTLLYRLLDLPSAQKTDLSSLRTVWYGAAPMSPTKLIELEARFGGVFVQVYGSSEHAGVATYMSKSDHQPIDGAYNHLASAGRPVPGVELTIRDDGGALLGSGEPGEIWLRSRAICLGYLNNAEATAQEFEDGWWKSGDIGRIDEHGFVHIVDRKKDMIISGGFNIYATEVEAIISEHPDVVMSAVVGIPHEEWGESVHAEIVLREGARLAEEELRAHVKKRLGSYKAPKSVAFVTELPLSVVGKVLRRQVREKYWTDRNRSIG